MAHYSDCGLPLKIFVKEQNVVANDASEQPKKKYLPVKSLTGESAKEFYESLVGGSKSNLHSPRPIESTNAKSVGRVKGVKCKPSDLHKLAQNNEFEMLERVIRDNGDVSVDAVDGFGWTPLMCAACSRAREAVEVLLKNKADPHLCDKFGNSAVSLARKNNFDIVEIIKKFDRSKSVSKKKKPKPVKPIFCNICKSEFHTDVRTHESSTLHLFNSRPKNPRTFYGIPDSNRGFQLLLKNGWNREKGLGPNECGMKFPVKVKKKDDRIGIGGTCIDRTSCEDTNINGRHQMKKKRIISQKKREKWFERNYRLEFL